MGSVPQASGNGNLAARVSFFVDKRLGSCFTTCQPFADSYLNQHGNLWPPRVMVIWIHHVNTNYALTEMPEVELAIGADHAGFELKGQLIPWLRSLGHEVVDLGAHELDPEDDYPDFAATVAEAVQSGRFERGIIVCGSGVGASITANKVPGVRACLCHDTYTAHQGVEHDQMNVVCLGGRVIGIELSKEILTAFLSANFIPEPRFQRRLDKLIAVEKGLRGDASG